VNAVRVKICGLTRSRDVEAALESGANAVGVVFADSPRRVTAAQAARLLRPVSGAVLRVGLFMRASEEEIAAILDQVELDLLQFHGPADNAFCARFGLPFLKAIGVTSDRAAAEANRYPDASGILFDTPAPGGAGGTGRTFDWTLLGAIQQPLWLAGGLNPENVAPAIELVGPDWVDVSSGVEDRPGVKNADRIRAFVEAAKSARPLREPRNHDSEDLH
jgi:phosphoribosylanthranilate isomerase